MKSFKENLLKRKFPILILLMFAFLKVCFGQYTTNQALSLNGTDGYLAIANATSLCPTTGLTIEAWINPSEISPSAMTIVGKNYSSSYFLGIESSGRVFFNPIGSTSFRSRETSTIPVNKWTHIAGTYDGNTTTIYINGQLDTSTVEISGDVGVNGDSLLIGADRFLGSLIWHFKGKLDNVRIWGTAKTAATIQQNRFIPLEIFSPTGQYANLRASYQFDGDFSNYSGSGLSMQAFSRGGATLDNYSNKAVNYMDYNNSLVLNGTTDHFTVANSSLAGLNPTSEITLEVWIRRDMTGVQPTAQSIVNKSGGTSRVDYCLVLFSNGQIGFGLNSETFFIQTPSLVTNSEWTHIAATYSVTTGTGIIYVNGNQAATGVFPGFPLIHNNMDNLYIGGAGATDYSSSRFKGQIDGVKIWSSKRSLTQIRENMYKGNTFEPGLTHFYFDKYTNAIYAGGVRIYTANTFAGSAHVSSSHLHKNNEPTSPILRDQTGGFYSANFTSSYRRFYVPDHDAAGIKDSIYIAGAGTVANLKVYVMMNHTYTADIKLELTSPNGTMRYLLDRKGGNGNDIFTIFSDAADSVAAIYSDFNGNGITAPFSPSIKPDQLLSSFTGQNKEGWWKIRFIDNETGDIGYVHGWGLNLISSPESNLKLTAFIQGFYDSQTLKMKQDTMKVFLRSVIAPYNILDTSKALVDSTGTGNFKFKNISTGTAFFIVATHRNSIETWSSTAGIFSTDTLRFDFSTASGQAFGSNQIFKAGRYCIYNGDSNQDGIVDATDYALVDNDAYNFKEGYLKTDMNGDNVIDASDAVVVDNNTYNFVAKITP